ncbi:BBE domain-containing protein [Pseudarthrobacter sp. NamE2]|uniref:BBE domain-containing protein n=1 Tax=Pseudarthrobacter sp. NamE2 TaxID=2576838 RepID=UPI001F0F3F23|nr:BBE domain-containing protein [Pseudarthrobacter sp. NamE2]
MQPFAEEGEYLNFLGSGSGQDPEAARRTYGQDTFARLIKLKQRYDPNNLFSRNHNILPRQPQAASWVAMPDPAVGTHCTGHATGRSDFDGRRAA